ncbi:MAG: hypothetical protein NXI32_30825, partial [bacterium]|nr:hypothetical protein [bacterium]
VDLRLTASKGGGEIDVPWIRSDLQIDWQIQDLDLTSSWFTNSPSVEFANVELNYHGYLAHFIAPFVRNMELSQAASDDLFRWLTTPVFNEPLFGFSNFLDLLGDSPDHRAARDRIGNLEGNLAAALANASPTWVRLGEFLADGSLARRPGFSSKLSPLGVTVESASNITSQLAAELSLQEFVAFMGSRGLTTPKSGVLLVGNPPPGTFQYGPFYVDEDILSDIDSGIDLRLLRDPLAAFELMLGHEREILKYDMPDFSIEDVEKDFFIPLPGGVIGIRLGGGIGGAIQYDFGLDSEGLRQYQESGRQDESTLLDGFYVRDKAETGEEITEAEFRVSFSVAGEVNVETIDRILRSLPFGGFRVEIRAGVEGVITLIFRHDFASTGSDPKVRGQEFKTNAELGSEHLFDKFGNSILDLSAYAKVLAFLPVPKVRIAGKTIGGGETEIEVFNLDLPILSTTLGGWDSIRTVGPLATLVEGRLTLNTSPFNDDFRVGRVDEDTLFVETQGRRQHFDGVTQVIAYGGTGNDSFVVDSDLNWVTVEFYGDDGDDRLLGGGAAYARLYGGDG